jgi:hypothetical protein
VISGHQRAEGIACKVWSPSPIGRPRRARTTLRLACLAIILILAMAACAGSTGIPGPTPSPDSQNKVDRTSGRDDLDEQHLLDIAWAALEPNTSSHDLANWEGGEVRRVEGGEVADEFDDERPGYGCPGPTPVANSRVKSDGTYWYAQIKRRPATPPPGVTPISPTAPPQVPEPFMYQAIFLIDDSGQVVARKLYCVIY